jgi:ATP-dependent RNA helicase DDX35
VLNRAVQVRNQLRSYLVRFGLPVKSDVDLDKIRKCVISGLFANAAQLQPDGSYKSIRGGKDLSIHPNSSLFKGTLPEWIVYGELIYTSKPFANQCTPVTVEWLAEIAPTFFEFRK